MKSNARENSKYIPWGRGKKGLSQERKVVNPPVLKQRNSENKGVEKNLFTDNPEREDSSSRFSTDTVSSNTLKWAEISWLLPHSDHRPWEAMSAQPLICIPRFLCHPLLPSTHELPALILLGPRFPPHPPGLNIFLWLHLIWWLCKSILPLLAIPAYILVSQHLELCLSSRRKVLLQWLVLRNSTCNLSSLRSQKGFTP